MARSEQATPHDDRRLARRWSSTTTRANEPVRIFDSGVDLREPETFGEFRLTYRTGDIVSPRIDAAEPLAIELRDFCHAIRKATQPRSSSVLGVEVVRMMEAVDKSLESDRECVSPSTPAFGRLRLPEATAFAGSLIR